MTFAGWDTPLELVKSELTQLRYEGVVVPKNLNDQVAELARDKDKNDMNFYELEEIYDSLSKLEVSSNFRYDQPNILSEIQKKDQKVPGNLQLWVKRSCLINYMGLGRVGLLAAL